MQSSENFLGYIISNLLQHIDTLPCITDTHQGDPQKKQSLAGQVILGPKAQLE